MYNIRRVIKPRKIYICERCGCDILGEHNYVAQVFEGDFHYSREHIECAEFYSKEVCYYCDECVGLSPECFRDTCCDECEEKESSCEKTIHECIKEKLEVICETN